MRFFLAPQKSSKLFSRQISSRKSRKNQDWSRKLFLKSRKIWIIATILIEITCPKPASTIKNLFYAKVYYFTSSWRHHVISVHLRQECVHVHSECTFDTLIWIFKIFICQKNDFRPIRWLGSKELDNQLFSCPQCQFFVTPPPEITQMNTFEPIRTKQNFSFFLNENRPSVRAVHLWMNSFGN